MLCFYHVATSLVETINTLIYHIVSVYLLYSSAQNYNVSQATDEMHAVFHHRQGKLLQDVIDKSS